MKRILPKMLGMLVIAMFPASQAHAYCARCAKIEEERAKEQAAHPQPLRYYDAPASPASNEKALSTQKQAASPAKDELGETKPESSTYGQDK